MSNMCSGLDLHKVTDCFNNSLEDEDDILMDNYIEGFSEINKFFQLLGSVFTFVSSDVKSKIEILQELRKKENADKFKSFKIMFEFEKTSDLLTKSNYISGSRTLLRLHRGLEFIREFLFKLHTIEQEEKTSYICQNAYNSTLAKHHPWIVRQGAIVAMFTLPTREQLLKKVRIEVDEAKLLLPKMLEIIKIVHERTEKLYKNFDLHNLP